VEDQHGRLLIAEDDSALRRSLHTTLGSLGFSVSEASNGEDALVNLRTGDFEAVLLDINMPGIGGIETCRRMRHISTKLQILMLTVRDDEDDKVEALEAGADDYVTKPFQSRELAARLHTAIRRFRAPQVPADRTIVIGSILLDPVRRHVERSGVEVHLTAREFNALQLLMTQAVGRLPMRGCCAPCAAQTLSATGPICAFSSVSSARSSRTIPPTRCTFSPTATSGTAFANHEAAASSN
jgi:two-component system KDP operon response regulator KdpE